MTIEQALAEIDLKGQLSVLVGYCRAASNYTGLTPIQCRNIADRLETIASELGRCCHDEQHDGAGTTPAYQARD